MPGPGLLSLSLPWDKRGERREERGERRESERLGLDQRDHRVISLREQKERRDLRWSEERERERRKEKSKWSNKSGWGDERKRKRTRKGGGIGIRAEGGKEKRSFFDSLSLSLESPNVLCLVVVLLSEFSVTPECTIMARGEKSKEKTKVETDPYREDIKSMLEEIRKKHTKMEEEEEEVDDVEEEQEEEGKEMEIEEEEEIDDDEQEIEEEEEEIDDEEKSRNGEEEEEIDDDEGQRKEEEEENQVEEEKGEEEEIQEEEEEEEEDDEDEVGDPSRDPGEGCTKYIDPDHLVPFRLGWKREVVRRENNANSISISTQYDIFYVPPLNTRYRTREAKRKRRSKKDQEKYFEDFPSKELSIMNFNYVRRPLGINNAAYEIVRKARKDDVFSEELQPAKITTPRNSLMSAKPGGKKSYKEVDESAGLLEDDESDDEGSIEFREGFDLELPLTLQSEKKLVGLRTEHKRRRRHRDPETCCTPPLAEDMLWSEMDEDPLGVYNDLGGRSSPTTPPPLRAVKLTPANTAEKILSALDLVRKEAAKVEMLKEQEIKDNMASHDAAITKFRDYVQKTPYLHRPTPLMPGKRPMNLNRSPMMNSSVSGQRQQYGDPLVKVKLPMFTSNGKRPVVELVMLQPGGRYQPIKFSNNMQVTEAIPKSKFDEANLLRKTVYMKATQVPRVGGKPLFLAVNPSAAAANRLNSMLPGVMAAAAKKAQASINRGSISNSVASQAARRPPPTTNNTQNKSRQTGGNGPTDQVSILVRPSKGPNQKPVLLNVPRRIAIKVKPGTTLSFSASNDQKYTVIDSKIHPAVKMGPSKQQNDQGGINGYPSLTQHTQRKSPNNMFNRALPNPHTGILGAQRPGGNVAADLFRQSSSSAFTTSLSDSVSIRPIIKPRQSAHHGQFASKPFVKKPGVIPAGVLLKRPSQESPSGSPSQRLQGSPHQSKIRRSMPGSALTPGAAAAPSTSASILTSGEM